MESDWSVQTVPFFCPMTDDHVCSRRLVRERGDLEKTKHTSVTVLYRQVYKRVLNLACVCPCLNFWRHLVNGCRTTDCGSCPVRSYLKAMRWGWNKIKPVLFCGQGCTFKDLEEFYNKPELITQTSRVYPLGSLSSCWCWSFLSLVFAVFTVHMTPCAQSCFITQRPQTLSNFIVLSLLLLFGCQRPVGGTVGVVSFKHIVLDEALHLLPTCRLKPNSIGFKRWQVVFSRVCEKLNLVKICTLHFEVKLFVCWWTKTNRVSLRCSIMRPMCDQTSIYLHTQLFQC